MRHCKPILAAAGLTFWASTLSAIAANPPQFDDVKNRIRKALVESSMPSIAVGVARDGMVAWEEGFGWADRENRIQATEHTMYSLASISKPFTATGLMVLVGRGEISLDEPINKYLGEARLNARVGAGDQATVRRVTNHTAGLPLHYQFFYEDEAYGRPSMEETIRRYGNLITKPGERFQYSNLGFGVLDYVISRVSGESFADFMRSEVFLPLGLTHTSVGIDPGLERHQAIRYGRDGLPIPFYDFDHRGGSAVYSSAHDLVRFGMFHLKNHLAGQRAILTDASIEEMQRMTYETGSNTGRGIAWALGQTRKGLRTVSHSGSMGGVSTLLTLVPEGDAAVAVLANSNNGPVVSTITRDILVALNLDLQERSAEDTAPSRAAEPNFRPTSDLVGTWTGAVSTYAGELSMTLWVKESGDIHARLGDQLETLLNTPSFRDEFLRGRMAGDLGTEDANRRPYDLQLEVRLRDRTLNGGITAISRPGKRVGNALTHWVELTKQ